MTVDTIQQDFMKKIVRLGVDIGTTSVAVAACIEEGDSVVFLPPVVKYLRWDKTSAKKNEQAISAFERGEPMTGRTPASLRRLYRSGRKTIRRRRARMNRLAKLLRLRLGHDNSYVNDLTDLKIRALSEPIDTPSLCHILMNYARFRGYSQLQDEDEETSSEYLNRMQDVSDWCREHNKTISQFLRDHGLRAHAKDADERSSGGIPVDQSMYRDELGLIWKNQAQYDARLTDELFAELSDVIYERRPLKSQKHLKSKCELEKDKRVCPRSDPWFESFKTWAKLRNMRLSHDRDPVVLSESCLQDMYAVTQQKDLTASSIFNVVRKHYPHFDKKKLFTKEEIPAMGTMASIRKVLGEISMEAAYEVWHCLHSEPTVSAKKNALIKHGHSEVISDALSRIRLAQGTSSYSHKAVRKLLPLMDGTVGSLDEYNAREKEYPSQAAETALLATIPQGQLRNPLVESVINEAIRTIKAYTASAGIEPTEIVVEMTRSLSRTAKQRKNDVSHNKRRAKINKQASGVLEMLGVSVSINNRRRFLLWQEQGGQWHVDGNKVVQDSPALCLYSGLSIDLTRAFDPLFCEQEHTIPRSRLFMNGMNNLSLATKKENKEKDNLTALEYIQQKPETEQAAFHARVERFYGSREMDRKRDLFYKSGRDLDTLLGENHLVMTGYIAKALKNRLRGSFKTVVASNGTVTSLIRQAIGVGQDFNKMVSAQRGEEVKDKRVDLRHHGMDALVCSLVRQGFIQRLSTANKLGSGEKMEGAITHIEKVLSGFSGPMMLALEAAMVFQPRERDPLINRKGSIGVRGSLHAQNPVKKYDMVRLKIDGGPSKEMAKLIKREKDLKAEGRDLHKEFAPLFRSPYVESIAAEYLSQGKTLKEFTNDKRLDRISRVYMIDPNLTAQQYKRRDGHYLCNNTNHRAILMNDGSFIVEPLHVYIDNKQSGKEVLRSGSEGVHSIFYSKSLVLLGMKREEFNERVAEGDVSWLNSLYWVSGIEGDGGRMKLYPHNMTSSEANERFVVRKNPRVLDRERGFLILDQREVMTAWLRAFQGEAV